MLCLNDTVAARPLTDEEKRLWPIWPAMVVDEMEFRRAERERREVERLFASVFETAAGGHRVIDEAGQRSCTPIPPYAG